MAAKHAGAISIAKKLGRTLSSVRGCAQKLRIIIRRPREPYRIKLPENQIVEDYKAGNSINILAIKYNVDWHTIERALKENNISTRPLQNKLELSLKGKEIIDGLLLGDASVCKSKTRPGRSPKFMISQTLKRASWIYKIASDLNIEGLKGFTYVRQPKACKYKNRIILGKEAHVFESKHYPELSDLRERWYPNGTKIVPKDLILTPLIVAQWFCGDGTYGKCGNLSFCTNSFSIEDVDFLIFRLKQDLGIYALKNLAKKNSNQWVIHISRKNEAYKLANIIKPFMHESCFYKLKYVRQIFKKSKSTQ